MTIKEKKEFLNSYRYLNSEIDRLLSECERYRAIATKTTPTYSNTPKAQTNTSKLETVVEKITELENKMNEKIDILIEKRKEIEVKILSVKDEKLQEILKSRYIDFKTWEQIAVDMNYCYMHICRLHGQALEKML